MAEIDGKQVVRSYTPSTLDDDKGHFDLVVKVSFVTSVCSATIGEKADKRMKTRAKLTIDLREGKHLAIPLSPYYRPGCQDQGS